MDRLAFFLGIILSFHFASAFSFVCENKGGRIEVAVLNETFSAMSSGGLSSSLQGVLIRSAISTTDRSKFLSGALFLDANHLSAVRSDLSCYGNVSFISTVGGDNTHSLTYNASAHIRPPMDIIINSDPVKDFFLMYKFSSSNVGGSTPPKLEVKFQKSDCEPQADQLLYQSFVANNLMVTQETLREVAEGTEAQDSTCYYQRDLTYSE